MTSEIFRFYDGTAGRRSGVCAGLISFAFSAGSEKTPPGIDLHRRKR